MMTLPLLDVAIGLTGLFCLLAILASSLRELVATALSSRGLLLHAALTELVGADGARRLYEHPLIFGLYRGSYPAAEALKGPMRVARARHLPSYLPAHAFAAAAYGIAVDDSHLPAPKSDLAKEPDRLTGVVGASLRAAAARGSGPLQELEYLYDASMERIAGRYRRESQWWLLAIASVLTITLNANTIDVAKSLYGDPVLRETLAERLVQARQADDSVAMKRLTTLTDSLASIGLPIGYAAADSTVALKWAKVTGEPLGYLLTILATSLGAPLWFDLLGRLVNLRATLRGSTTALRPPEVAGETDAGVRPLAIRSATDWNSRSRFAGGAAATVVVGDGDDDDSNGVGPLGTLLAAEGPLPP